MNLKDDDQKNELNLCRSELRSIKESYTYRIANKIRQILRKIVSKISWERRWLIRFPHYKNRNKKTVDGTLEALPVSQWDDEKKNIAFWTIGTLHHQPQRLSGQDAITKDIACKPDDAALVQRLIDAYSKAYRTSLESQGAIWHDYVTVHNKETHEILIRGDLKEVTTLLRNPGNSMLFYGFDGLSSLADIPKMSMAWWRRWRHVQCYDNLLRLAEVVGIVRLQHPEAPLIELETAEVYDTEFLLNELDHIFGFHIDFPNLFPAEIGLLTSRGVASYRAIQALYQAYRINELLNSTPSVRILEIGAGLGRTAYYSAKFGTAKYTIVDLSLVNVAQGYYLGRIYGEKSLQLLGESQKDSLMKAKFRIIPPHQFFLDKENYDLILNVDSLTEMSKIMATQYFEEISLLTSCFLSVNHEYNQFTCRDIYLNFPTYISKVHRTLYPMRRGYVEEIIEFLHK